MKSIPMTEETKVKLLENTEFKIIQITSSVDEIRRFLLILERVSSSMSSRNIDIDLKNIERLSEYRMLIGLLFLDLTTSMRIYLNAKFQYEGLFSLRQIIVIINEGYKKIYNFITKKSSGGVNTKYREESFWIQDIGAIIKFDFPVLRREYDTLTNELEEYFKINFDDIKEQRDLSIHYDRKPVKVYDMLTKLDFEETFKKMIPFLNILNKMFDFTLQIISHYKEKTDRESENNKMTIERIISNLENFKNSENGTNVSELQESLRNIGKL